MDKPEAYPTEPDEESMTCGRVSGQEAERRGWRLLRSAAGGPASTGCEWAKGWNDKLVGGTLLNPSASEHSKNGTILSGAGCRIRRSGDRKSTRLNSSHLG